jgi:hypothetical protein
MRVELNRAMADIQTDYKKRIEGLQAAYTASEENRVQSNFFTFVEEAKEANPEAFAALNSGLVYSDKDVWDVANRLMDERADLRENFDEDRLLEAVEAEARKDSRWAKVQQLTKNSLKPQQSKPVPSQSNARANEEAAEPAPKKAAAPRPPTPRAPDGTFVRSSPFERHASHVDRVLQRVKFGG